MSMDIEKKRSVHYMFNHPERINHLVKHSKASIWLFYTRYELEDLREILMYPEYLQVIYNKGVDTFNHLVLLDNSVIKRLHQERWNYIDFRPYMIDKERNFPSKGKLFNLYIKCPIEMPLERCKNIINERLHLFSKYGLIPDDSWKMECTYRRSSIDSMPWRKPMASQGERKSKSCDNSPNGSPREVRIFYNLIIKFTHIKDTDDRVGVALVRTALQHDYWLPDGMKINCQWQNTN
jgi:hypothetical protein